MTIKDHQTRLQPLYHILPRADWGKALAAGMYTPESLETEGFIHFSTRNQVIQTANRYYNGHKGLLILRIDQTQLTFQVLFEDIMGVGEDFPHLYGPLELPAVSALCALEPEHDGSFGMPKDVDWIWLDPDDMFLDADMSLLPYQLPGKVYRSAMPFSSMFDPAGLILDAYHAAGIDLIVMLTQETDVQRFVGWDLMKRYRSLGFDILSTPIRDFSVPERGALDEPVRQTLKAAKEGRTIVIHCHAGLGRTGMFAACLARLVFGMDGLEARAWVRQHVPHAVETGEQFRFIQSFGLSED